MQVNEVNKINYNTSYKANSILSLIVKRILSFDQKSKSKINKKYIKSILIENNIKKVLEIGCGYGLNISRLPQNIEVYGVDISEEGVLNCKKIFNLLYKNTNHFFVEDANNKLKYDTKFDLIISSHVIEHLYDDVHFLNNVNELLDENRFLLINVPINERYHEPNHVRKYTEIEIITKLNNAGFKIISAMEYDRWSLFFNKLRNEKKITKNILYKPMRAILAMIPLIITELTGSILLKKYPKQQLVLICQKTTN